MTTVGVTGANGFLGWHVRARLHLADIEVVSATRDTFADPGLLDHFVQQSGAIIHVAGVNRANTDEEVADGNRELAQQLIDAMGRTGKTVPTLYTNSTQSERDNVYGRAKQAAADLLTAHCEEAGVPCLDLVLPHLFGEYGKPHYNSAVTTFAHELAVGGEPSVNRDGQLELLHAQDVAARVLDFIAAPTGGRARMTGVTISVGEVWDLMQTQHRRYANEFTVPDCANRFELQIFNTLRSQLYLNGFYPRSLTLHADNRGAFAELCRADCLGQTSVSTSVPGITRGDHFHLDKIERFIVLDGTATIRIRRVLTNEVTTHEVSGENPVYIDMPPLATHNITNTGDTTLTTLFWAADHFDPNNPDTYVDPVQTVGAPA